MYEVRCSKREIKGITIPTWKAEIINANMLEVEVGTTGYCGGDTGHGGRTYLRLKDLGSTDLSASIVTDNCGDTEEVIMEFGGDTELSTLIEALEFAVKVLKDQTKNS